MHPAALFIVAWSLLGVVCYELCRLSGIVSPSNCKPVHATLGSVEAVRMFPGALPSWNRVSGELKCHTASGNRAPVRKIDLPLWYCPSNLFVNRVAEVKSFIDMSCLPVDKERLFLVGALADEAGRPAFLTEASVADAVKWPTVSEGERKAIIDVEYNIHTEGWLKTGSSQKTWMPLRIPDLSTNVVVLVSPTYIVAQQIGVLKKVSAAWINKSMWSYAKIDSTREDVVDNYIQTVLDFVSPDGHSFKILHFAELRPTEECLICLGTSESGEPLKPAICGHRYHEACIDAWKERSPRCPLCRIPLP